MGKLKFFGIKQLKLGKLFKLIRIFEFIRIKQLELRIK